MKLLFFYIQAAGRGLDQTFFGKFVKCVAKLPGVKARFGFSVLRNRKIILWKTGHLNLIYYIILKKDIRYW